MSFRNKRTGAFQPFGGLFSTEKTGGLTRTAPAFVQNQTQSTMGMANQYRPVVVQPRVAPINQDQTAFFNTARNYAQQAMNRRAPEIDTSTLERQLGRTVDTSGIDRLIGQRANMGGVLGMVGRRADMSGLQGLVGERIDTSGLQDAAAQSVSTDELGALMGQQNVARDIYQDFTTREVTPYLETQIDDATDRALQNVSNLYAGSGRLGSAAFADAAARGVTAASAPILQQAAQTDAARQLQAAGMLGQAFSQDRAMDASLADRRAAIMSTNFGRQLQGQGMLANIGQASLARDAALQGQITGFEDAAIGRDLNANQFAAQMQNNAINRDAGLAQSSAGFQSNDLARDAGLAGQLTNASRQQAMLAPTMQQMDMANMGLLAQIGAQQQAQQQAQYNAQLQYAQLMNQANQQRYNNMVMASQLGQPFIGQETYGDQGMFNSVLGAGATAVGLGWNPFGGGGA